MPELATRAMQPNRQGIDGEAKGRRRRNPVLAFKVNPADELRILRLDGRQDHVNALACCGLDIITYRVRVLPL